MASKILLNHCLNKEGKYYGLSYGGVIGGAVIGSLIWAQFGMIVGIMGMVAAYGIAAYISAGWHSGRLQRFLYWQMPVKKMFGGKYLPESHQRCFL